jgi:hypothetical protein
LDAAYHFMPLSLIINNSSNISLFKFPDLRGMANYLEIKDNVACEHINKIPKPVSFDQSQLERIQKAYAKDIEIYKQL